MFIYLKKKTKTKKFPKNEKKGKNSKGFIRVSRKKSKISRINNIFYKNMLYKTQIKTKKNVILKIEIKIFIQIFLHRIKSIHNIDIQIIIQT